MICSAELCHVEILTATLIVRLKLTLELVNYRSFYLFVLYLTTLSIAPIL